MKLEEAIKINTRHLDYPFEVNTASLEKAQKLGIEALKRIRAERKYLFALRHPLLPGETEE